MTVETLEVATREMHWDWMIIPEQIEEVIIYLNSHHLATMCPPHLSRKFQGQYLVMGLILSD